MAKNDKVLVIDGQKFKDTVSVFGNIITPNSREVVLSSINFEYVDGGSVILRATNMDTYVNVKLPIKDYTEGKDDKYIRNVSVSYKDLSQIAPYIDDTFTLVLTAKGMFVEVFKGVVEVHGVSDDSVTPQDFEPRELTDTLLEVVEKEFDWAGRKADIASMVGIVGSAQQVTDRRVHFTKTFIGVRERWSSFKAAYQNENEYTLSAKDVDAVVKLTTRVCTDNSEKCTVRLVGDSGCQLVFDWGWLYCTRFPYSSKLMDLINIGLVDEVSAIKVTDNLRQLVAFSNSYSTSTQRWGFKQLNKDTVGEVVFCLHFVNNKKEQYALEGEGFVGTTANMAYTSDVTLQVLSMAKNGDTIKLASQGLIIQNEHWEIKMLGKVEQRNG